MDVPSPPPPASHRVVSSVRCARWLALSFPLWIAGCYSGHPGLDPDPWGGADDGAEGMSDTDAQDDDGGDSASGGGSHSSGGDGAGDDSDTAGHDDGGGVSSTTGADDGGVGDTGAQDDGGTDDGGAGVDDGADDDDGGDDGGSGSDDVPDSAYCQDAATWTQAWANLEQEILTIVNERRAAGANCGTQGNFGSAPPLTMNPALRCASRNHSKDMAVNNYFSHNNLQGQTPFQRMQLAGYSYSAAGENIAAGNSTAAATMQQWMNSDGHCANIMNPNFQEIGVGYYPGGGYGHYWTQKFGRP
jgi:uncharacterized protein YkwD